MFKSVSNRAKRFWIWSKVNKIKFTSENELSDIDKHIINVFKSMLRDHNNYLYKVVDGADVTYEIHDSERKVYMFLLHKSNGSEVKLIEFPNGDKSLYEYKTYLPPIVSNRLVQSYTHEIYTRSLHIKEAFMYLQKNNLANLTKKYDNMQIDYIEIKPEVKQLELFN